MSQEAPSGGGTPLGDMSSPYQPVPAEQRENASSGFVAAVARVRFADGLVVWAAIGLAAAALVMVVFSFFPWATGSGSGIHISVTGTGSGTLRYTDPSTICAADPPGFMRDTCLSELTGATSHSDSGTSAVLAGTVIALSLLLVVAAVLVIVGRLPAVAIAASAVLSTAAFIAVVVALTDPGAAVTASGNGKGFEAGYGLWLVAAGSVAALACAGYMTFRLALRMSR